MSKGEPPTPFSVPENVSDIVPEDVVVEKQTTLNMQK
jgi:hypothetical protein